MDHLIEIQGLTRKFGDKLAVSDLNLTVTRGEVFGFLGPNGAGKTTTIRLLNGILKADSGSATVLGWDVATHATEIRRQAGVLTETPSLYEGLTACENLTFYAELFEIPPAQVATRVAETLEEFGLAARADDKVGTYSKGMRQRLAIGRALLHAPELIFLDEPTSGLDPEASRMVRDLIRQLSHRDGRTVFLCTHNLAEAQTLCTRVGVIDSGRLQAIGAPRELARQLWQAITVDFGLRDEPQPAALDALDRIDGIRSRHFELGKLSIEFTSEDSIPQAIEALTQAGERIYSVVPQEHSLEEIYFKVQAESRQNGGQA